MNYCQNSWTEILEQPKSSGLRFRYKCEGKKAGSMFGENSTGNNKSYPTVKIHNIGPAAVVVVSCVCKDKPYFPHPNSLVGKGCDKGVCTVRLKGHDTVSLPSIGIQCCKRQDVKEALQERRSSRIDPFCTGYMDDIARIDLTAVRLCFQVFLLDPETRRFTRIVEPVVSQEIVDKKLKNNLQICRLSKQAGFAKGGEEIFILCDKIKKDNVKVRFFQMSEDGEETVWESMGQFTPADIHRQCAIVCTIPAYKDVSIRFPVIVQIQLVGLNDKMSGDPKPFQYVPNDTETEAAVETKRRKLVSSKPQPQDLQSYLLMNPTNNFQPSDSSFHHFPQQLVNISVDRNPPPSTSTVPPTINDQFVSLSAVEQSRVITSTSIPTIAFVYKDVGGKDGRQQMQEIILEDGCSDGPLKLDWQKCFSSTLSDATQEPCNDFSYN